MRIWAGGVGEYGIWVFGAGEYYGFVWEGNALGAWGVHRIHRKGSANTKCFLFHLCVALYSLAVRFLRSSGREVWRMGGLFTRELRIHTWSDGVCFLENKQGCWHGDEECTNSTLNGCCIPLNSSHTKERKVSEDSHVTNLRLPVPSPSLRRMAKLKSPPFYAKAETPSIHYGYSPASESPDSPFPSTTRNFSKIARLRQGHPRSSTHFPFLHIHRYFPSPSPVSEGPPPLSPPRPLMEQYIRRLRLRQHLILKLNKSS